MKRIVLCFDGTWNKPADENLPSNQQVETNVRRFYEAVLPVGADGIPQVRWYDEGIGTHWYDRFLGGMFGAGLELNILEGYKFLVNTYEDGDEIYVLGFSRGAYTARSLVGLLRNCGLVKKGLSDLKIGSAYGLYRARDDGPDSITARLFREAFSREVRVKFVGVWDTVGALGIPLDLLQKFNMKFFEFHDTQLSRIVENAFHAVAVNENRIDYEVCLWNPTQSPTQTLEQRWFIGAHSNIGGGYADRQLSDIPLGWMMNKASAVGLGLNPFQVGAQNYQASVVDSYAEFLNGKYAKLKPRHLRQLRATAFGNEVIDETVRKRLTDDPTYHPGNTGLTD